MKQKKREKNLKTKRFFPLNRGMKTESRNSFLAVLLIKHHHFAVNPLSNRPVIYIPLELHQFHNWVFFPFTKCVVSSLVIRYPSKKKSKWSQVFIQVECDCIWIWARSHCGSGCMQHGLHNASCVHPHYQYMLINMLPLLGNIYSRFHDTLEVILLSGKRG